jgi:hypothetical protein
MRLVLMLGLFVGIAACGGHTDELTDLPDATVANTAACTPGDQLACGCSGSSSSGLQLCNSDGKGYGPCQAGTRVAADADAIPPEGDDDASEPGADDSGGEPTDEDAGIDAAPPPNCGDTTCTAPEVCINIGDGHPHCGPACQSDSDCPAWLTCTAGQCSECGECPAGQQCKPVTVFPDMGPGYSACVPCTAEGNCTRCTTNSQCKAGEVCSGGKCTACSSNAQCGPSAQCIATHTTQQCTCSATADCASGESCVQGLCAPGCCTNNDCSPGEACTDGLCQPCQGSGCACGSAGDCATGQACINSTCGECATYEDCNRTHGEAFVGEPKWVGLTCINRACTACASNSQCGGAQACVAGTCGTCVKDSQCGAAGVCSGGFCECTSDAQCDSGQRCGAGVCVGK